jgi:hypothetical protein
MFREPCIQITGGKHFTVKVFLLILKLHFEIFRQITLCSGVLLEKLTAPQSTNSAHFMVPDGSMPLSQQLSACPFACPFPGAVQSGPSYFLKFYCNIVLPSTTRSSKRCLALRFIHQDPICIYALPDLRPVLRPSHSSWFGHQNDTSWGAQIIKLLIRHPPPVVSYVISLRPKFLPHFPNLIPLSSALPQGQRLRITLTHNCLGYNHPSVLPEISIQQIETTKHNWVITFNVSLPDVFF